MDLWRIYRVYRGLQGFEGIYGGFIEDLQRFMDFFNEFYMSFDGIFTGFTIKKLRGSWDLIKNNWDFMKNDALAIQHMEAWMSSEQQQGFKHETRIQSSNV